jgi:hypothetical protein
MDFHNFGKNIIIQILIIVKNKKSIFIIIKNACENQISLPNLCDNFLYITGPSGNESKIVNDLIKLLDNSIINKK